MNKMCHGFPYKGKRRERETGGKKIEFSSLVIMRKYVQKTEINRYCAYNKYYAGAISRIFLEYFAIVLWANHKFSCKFTESMVLLNSLLVHLFQ